jgi:hypothetical protein
MTVTQELELGLVNLYLALNPLLSYMGREKKPADSWVKIIVGSIFTVGTVCQISKHSILSTIYCICNYNEAFWRII